MSVYLLDEMLCESQRGADERKMEANGRENFVEVVFL
jgi:hypothetical protein